MVNIHISVNAAAHKDKINAMEKCKRQYLNVVCTKSKKNAMEKWNNIFECYCALCEHKFNAKWTYDNIPKQNTHFQN